jgi:hypothetical protein
MIKDHKQKPSPDLHNYMKILMRKFEENIAPGVHHVEVLHDPWCAFLNNKGTCNCNPEIGKITREQ